MAPISDIERKAYSNIYERYYRKLLGICLSYVHDSDVAKDILHDSFIIIFSRIDSLREQEKLEPWMCSIVRNIALKHLEKEKKFAGTDMSAIKDIEEEENITADIYSIPFEDLMQAIDKLPTQYGKVFKLSVLEGLSHQEIGEMLGIAPHSSSSNLARAKQLLRKIINQQWGILLTLALLLFAIFHFSGRKEVPAAEEEMVAVVERTAVADSTAEEEEILIAMADPVAHPARNIETEEITENTTAREETETMIETESETENETDTEDTDIQEVQDCIDRYDTDDFEEDEPRKARNGRTSFTFAFGGHGAAGNGRTSDMGSGCTPGVDNAGPGFESSGPEDPGVGNPDLGDDATDGAGDNGQEEDEEKTGSDAMKRRSMAGRSADSGKYRHHMPISFAASVNWETGERWSIGTGLRYTFLRSDIIKDRYTGRQKIHYIGIPLKASYTFWDSRFCNAYVSAGALFEMPVSAHIDKRRIDVPCQWSAGAGIGLQYEVTRTISLYVEPELYYYFDTGSDIRTIRTDKPLSITIPVGIRFSW